MKLTDEHLIGLSIVCGAVICLSLIAGAFYGSMTQKQLYQQTYNKNMECRIEFKGRSSSEMDRFCGKIPEIGDFVK